MRISELHIENFRGLQDVTLTGLKGIVIVAGPNGCGKSCILEALRLLKTTYGEYDRNEYQQWLGELQVRQNNTADDIAHLFFDKSKSIVVEAIFELHDDEVSYLAKNAEKLAKDLYWRVLSPADDPYYRTRSSSVAAQVRARQGEVEARTTEVVLELISAQSQKSHKARLELRPDGSVGISPSAALEILFSTYEPGKLGIFDYHGPQRLYQRESVSSVNLALNENPKAKSQHALYNYSAKYQGVKSEMAALYISGLVAQQANKDVDHISPLVGTMEALFSTFFPDKKFLGPVATESGGISFPVELIGTGAVHDLDELSAGEKEIIYGYLRLKNSAPRYSLVLIDEPELHLNPKLIRSLPAFYHDHLSYELDNQIWFVTHSDALIREAVGKSSYSVFHMSPATAIQSGENQAREILAQDEFERLVIDMVGDLAAYRPGKDIILFEGENAEFDERMTKRLFPELDERINTTSVGSKSKVRSLHAIFDRMATKGEIPFTVYSVVDRDSGGDEQTSNARYLSWDAYHIENYLLEPKAIFESLEAIGQFGLSDECAVERALVECARSSLGPALAHRLRMDIEGEDPKPFALRVNQSSDNPAQELVNAAQALRERMNKSIDRLCDYESISEKEAAIRSQLDAEIESGVWRKTFRGRDVLKKFVEVYGGGIGYTRFRFMILDKLAIAGIRPSGMASVVTQIIGHQSPRP